MIGLGTGITSKAEFNKRAAKALKACKLTSPFITSMVTLIEAGESRPGGWPLSEKQQQGLYNAVHGQRRNITDKPLLDYAADRARGHDQ